MSVDVDAVKNEIREACQINEWIREMANNEETPTNIDTELITSNRGIMWNIFADEVARHIEHYTVPQYGDFPEDQASSWTEDDMVKQIQKYLNRINTNERGEMERDRDLMKIAHYVQMIWSKRMKFEEAFKEILDEDEPKEPAETVEEK